MAVTFNAVSTIASVGGTSTGLTASSITVSGTNALLLVAISANPGLTSPAVTYNSVSMTQIGTGFADTGTARFYIFGLVNPSAGSYTPVASWSSVSSTVDIISIVYNNAQQAALPSLTQNTTASQASPGTASITTNSVANPYVVGFFKNEFGNFVASTGSTLRSNGTLLPVWADSNGTVATSTPYSMSLTWPAGTAVWHALQLELNAQDAYTLTCAQASFALTGNATTLQYANSYTLALAQASFTMTAYALAFTGSAWTRQTKNIPTWTNQTRN